jgi:hypothetical protein
MRTWPCPEQESFVGRRNGSRPTTLLGADDATVILNTLPILVDSTPTFDTKLR